MRRLPEAYTPHRVNVDQAPRKKSVHNLFVLQSLSDVFWHVFEKFLQRL